MEGRRGYGGRGRPRDQKQEEDRPIGEAWESGHGEATREIARLARVNVAWRCVQWMGNGEKEQEIQWIDYYYYYYSYYYFLVVE